MERSICGMSLEAIGSFCDWDSLELSTALGQPDAGT